MPLGMIQALLLEGERDIQKWKLEALIQGRNLVKAVAGQWVCQVQNVVQRKTLLLAAVGH